MICPFQWIEFQAPSTIPSQILNGTSCRPAGEDQAPSLAKCRATCRRECSKRLWNSGMQDNDAVHGHPADPTLHTLGLHGAGLLPGQGRQRAADCPAHRPAGGDAELRTLPDLPALGHPLRHRRQEGKHLPGSLLYRIQTPCLCSSVSLLTPVERFIESLPATFCFTAHHDICPSMKEGQPRGGPGGGGGTGVKCAPLSCSADEKGLRKPFMMDTEGFKVFPYCRFASSLARWLPWCPCWATEAPRRTWERCCPEPCRPSSWAAPWR